MGRAHRRGHAGPERTPGHEAPLSATPASAEHGNSGVASTLAGESRTERAPSLLDDDGPSLESLLAESREVRERVTPPDPSDDGNAADDPGKPGTRYDQMMEVDDYASAVEAVSDGTDVLPRDPAVDERRAVERTDRAAEDQTYVDIVAPTLLNPFYAESAEDEEEEDTSSQAEKNAKHDRVWAAGESRERTAEEIDSDEVASWDVELTNEAATRRAEQTHGKARATRDYYTGGSVGEERLGKDGGTTGAMVSGLDSGSISTDKASLSLGRRRAHSTRDGDDTTGTVDDTTLGVESDKSGTRARLGRRSERTVHAGDGSTTDTREGYVAAGSDGFTIGGSVESETEHDDEGVVTKSSHGASGSIGVTADGITAHGGVSMGSESALDGSSQTTELTGDVDFAEGSGSVGFEREHKDSKGDKTGSFGGSVGLDLNAEGEIEGADIEANAHLGPVGVSFKGEMKVEAEEPQQHGDYWTVHWELSKNVEAGASGDVGVLTAGLSRKYTHVDDGTSRFESREAADEFRAHAASRVGRTGGGLTDDADAAASVLALAEGEFRGHNDSSETEGSAGGTYEGFGIALSVGAAESRGMRVTRQPGDVVELAMSTELATSSGLTLSSFGFAMGGTHRIAHGSVVTLRFHMLERSAQRCFNDFVQHGVTPVEGPGVEYVSTATTEAETDGHTLGMFGMKGSDTSTVSTKETVDAEGHRTEETTGTHASGVSGFGYEATASESFAATGDKGDGKGPSSYALSATIHATDGDDSEDMLARAAGVGESGHDVASSGTWHVTQAFTPRQIQLFCAAVAPRTGTSVLLRYTGRSGDALETALGRSHTDADRAAAVAAFVAADGDRAIAFIRQESGARRTEIDVALDNDDVFQGRAWRLSLERRIERYRRSVAQGDGTVRAGVEGDLNGLRFRLLALGDDSRYADLPRELRVEEVRRTRDWIATLQALVQELGTAETPVSASTTGAAPAADPAAAEAAQAALELAMAASERAQQTTDFDRDVHLRGAWCISAHPAIEQFGSRSGIGVTIGAVAADGGSAAFYQRAESSWQDGLRQLREAQSAARHTGDPVESLRRQTEIHQQARSSFRNAHAIYLAIRSTYRDSHPEYFTGYEHTPSTYER